MGIKMDGLLLVLYCGLIFFLSHQPTLPMPMLFPNQDKLVHASAYAVMGLLAWRFFSHLFTTQLLLVASSIIFCSVYGVSDEFHQSFIDGRDADVWDWLADTIGASLMVYMLYRFKYLNSNK